MKVLQDSQTPKKTLPGIFCEADESRPIRFPSCESTSVEFWEASFEDSPDFMAAAKSRPEKAQHPEITTAAERTDALPFLENMAAQTPEISKHINADFFCNRHISRHQQDE
jgi:hypothetical protein